MIIMIITNHPGYYALCLCAFFLSLTLLSFGAEKIKKVLFESRDLSATSARGMLPWILTPSLSRQRDLRILPSILYTLDRTASGLWTH